MADIELDIMRHRVLDATEQLISEIRKEHQNCLSTTLSSLSTKEREITEEALKNSMNNIEGLLAQFHLEMKKYGENHFFRLPSDVITHVFSFLNAAEVDGMTRVCKRFRNHIQSDDRIWKISVMKWWNNRSFLKPHNNIFAIIEELQKETSLHHKIGWKWFAKCVATQEDTGLSWSFTNAMLSFGNMKTKQMVGFGARIELSASVPMHFYYGSFKDNLYHGTGTYCPCGESKLAGSRYTGEWEGSLRHGKGVCTLSNGLTFEGAFEYNEPKGAPPEFMSAYTSPSAKISYRAKSGDQFQFEIGLKVKELWGVSCRQRMTTPRGPATVIGIKDGFLWFHIDGDPGASYWDNIRTRNDMMVHGFNLINPKPKKETKKQTPPNTNKDKKDQDKEGDKKDRKKKRFFL